MRDVSPKRERKYKEKSEYSSRQKPVRKKFFLNVYCLLVDRANILLRVERLVMLDQIMKPIVSSLFAHPEVGHSLEKN